MSRLEMEVSLSGLPSPGRGGGLKSPDHYGEQGSAVVNEPVAPLQRTCFSALRKRLWATQTKASGYPMRPS